MIFEDLTKIFDIAFIQFGIDNSIDVALEDLDYTPDVAVPYLATFMRLAPVEQGDLSVNEFRQGFYQVDINYAPGRGSSPINEMADLINAAFKTGQHITRNNICIAIEGVDLGPLIVGGGWVKAPLSINWNSFTARL